ncbi:DNA topoisomerase 2-binding protein [Dirofilaria immitis]
MPLKITSEKNRPSSEEIEMVTKYQLWLLKAEIGETIAGSPHSDELTHQEDLFQMLKEKSLNPKWITSKDCLKRKFECDDFYVLPAFRGKVFSRLLSSKCRVYGTLALITCLKRKERLPKRHSPIWSTTLQGSIVCFSGIEMKTRQHQILLVKMMGGTISKAFTKKVTHLVADSQDTKSKKFVTAVDYSVPVLSVSWIFAAWKSAKAFSERKYIDREFVSEHKLQIFAKCVISCSGIAPQDRSTLSHLIEANGGVYTGNMKKNYCTHLVTDLNSGEKYKIARKWGWNQIRIVRLRWITKSVEKGYRLPERLYETRVNSAIECSSPRASQFTNPEINVIRHATNQQQTAGTSEINGLFSNSIPEMHLTRSESIMTEINKSISTESNSLPKRTMMEVDPIVFFNLDALRFNDLMSDCIIYLCGIEDENYKKYKWLTNKLGSRRRDRLVYTDTTHVVVGPQKLDWKLIKQLKEKAQNNVKVVTCEWLLDCAKAQKVLDESNYLIFKHEKNSSEFSQYRLDPVPVRVLDYSDESKTENALKITEVGSKLLGKAIGNLTNAELDSAEEIIWERPTSNNDRGDSSDRHLFSGLSFRIVVRKEEIQNKLFSDIENHGGEIKQKTFWVNYIVCEVLDCLLSDDASFNCGNVVSSFWLQECIENGEIIDAEKHPLYRPIEALEISQIFAGCVVGLSTLPEAEKDIFADILYKFGADVQNQLGQDEQLNICTEIVTCAETDRTDSARRWKIPVLDPSWIIESVIQNRLLPVELYLFHDQPFKNYTRSDRLWMHATQRKPSDVRLNILDKISTNDELPIQIALSENEKEQCAKKDLQEPINNNLAAVLDLAEAFACVDGINSQNTMSNSSIREIWNDTTVDRVLDEAVIKTAQTRKALWTSSISDYNRMQTRQNKRNAEAVSLTEPVESPKKARTTVSENYCELVISKDEKKRRIAEKLAKLATQREEYVRSMQAEKEKQREQERKVEVQAHVESLKRNTKKRFAKPPEPEYYGWKESSPRPIATQILDPFDVDLENNGTYADEMVPMLAEVEKPSEENKMSPAEQCENAVIKETLLMPNKTICFTSIVRHDRNILETMVLELGGEVCNEFGEKITHLVCGRMVRNEKLLCSIAKGLAVVDEDYVIDSHAHSKWLEIDNYEWGSNHSLTKHNLFSQRFASFALACRRWRLKIEKNSTQRAFHSWKALFYCGRRRFSDLRRIIGFGGGEAYLRDDVFSLQGFTIALVEKSRFWNSKEVVELIKNNIQCYGIDYLATYLTLEETCEAEKHFHKDYLTELNRVSRC